MCDFSTLILKSLIHLEFILSVICGRALIFSKITINCLIFLIGHHFIANLNLACLFSLVSATHSLFVLKSGPS